MKQNRQHEVWGMVIAYAADMAVMFLLFVAPTEPTSFRSNLNPNTSDASDLSNFFTTPTIPNYCVGPDSWLHKDCNSYRTVPEEQPSEPDVSTSRD